MFRRTSTSSLDETVQLTDVENTSPRSVEDRSRSPTPMMNHHNDSTIDGIQPPPPLLQDNDSSTTTTTHSSCWLLLTAPLICGVLGVTLTPKFLVLAVAYLAAAARPLLMTAWYRMHGKKQQPDLNAMVRNALHSHRSLTVQFSMLAICLFLYERSRVLVVNQDGTTVHVAFETAKQIIRLEHAVGMDLEPWLQSCFLQHWLVVMIGNYYYALMHFIVPFGIMACLVITNRDASLTHRSSFFIMLVLALIAFCTLPTMPPRLLERYRREYQPQFDSPETTSMLRPYWNIVDTMAKGDTLYDKLHKEGGNPYAAMPSMHTGWALWSALVAKDVFSKNKWVVGLGCAHVFLTVFFILVTGNHFWLDAVGGAACVVFGRIAARKLTQESILQFLRRSLVLRLVKQRQEDAIVHNHKLLPSLTSTTSSSSSSFDSHDNLSVV